MIKLFASAKPVTLGSLAAAVFLLFGSNPVWGADSKILPGHVPQVVATLTPLGGLAATNQMRLAIGLPMRDPAGLDHFLAQVSDPASPNFRHYLTREELTARFGPTEQDYDMVKEFAQANGLTITATPANRLLLDVTGSASAVEKAFHITLRTYRHPTEPRNFFAPDTEPAVDAGLPVVDIQGLSDFGRPQPHLVRRPRTGAERVAPSSGTAPDGTGDLIGDDFRNAYVPGVTLTGAGQSVGLFEVDAYFASDIALYASQSGGGRSNIVITNILIDGFSGAQSRDNQEVSLDIEMAMAIAPGLAEIICFEGNPGYFIPNDVLNTMLADSNVVNLSSSWSWTGGPTATTDAIFQSMGAVGQTFFNASGDRQAFTPGSSSVYGVDNPSVTTTPCSSPYITEVGGTTLALKGAGASWQSEVVWNWATEYSDAGVGSSGGISSYYSIPTWQTNVSNLGGKGGSTTFRNIPDVAANADHIYVIDNNGDTNKGFIDGGTSAAAPLWAGYMALVNQQAAASGRPSAGFINPALYALAEVSSYPSTFHDVTNGNNTSSRSPTLFYATNNYDLCTGLGSMNGPNLIAAFGKATPAITTPPTASALTYGQALSASVLSGGVASVQGTFAFTTPATIPTAGTTAQLVTFTPNDSTDYNDAGVAVGVSVSKATPTITTAPTASGITYGQALSASVLSGGAASVPGTFAFTTPSTMPNIGTAPQGVTFTPTDTNDYNNASTLASVTVSKATPVVTTAPTASGITYGQALSASVLSGGAASVPGTFAFTTPGTMPTAGTAPQGVTFTPNDNTDYNNASTATSVSVSKATPVVTTAPTASGITYGQPLSASVLSGGAASVQGAFAFTMPSTVPNAGTASQGVTFTPTDNNDYNNANTTASVTVSQAASSITWTNPVAIVYGTPLGTNELNAGASVAGSFLYSPTNGAVLSAGTNVLSVAFTPASPNYSGATDSVTLVVSPACLSVTANDTNRAYGAANPAFTGTLTGVTNGDNITATYSTPATSASPAGPYPIVPSLVDPGNRLGNYTVSTTNGTLTVLAANALAPSAKSQPATGVTSNSATLNGVVNPNNAPTAVYFIWGPGSAYGNTNLAANLPAGTTTVGVSNTINGLTANKAYSFKVMAVNALGTNFSSGQSFSTPNVPQVTTLAASLVTSTTAVLNGSVTPKNAVTGAWFEWGATTSYGNLTSVTNIGSGSAPVAVSKLLTGLSPGAVYHFRLLATNSAGAGHGNDLTFTNLAGGPTAKTQPATSVQSTSATLNGSVNPNGAATTVYFIWGSGGTYGNTNLAANLAAGSAAVAVSNTLAGLTPNTAYGFKILAVNAAGTNLSSGQNFSTPNLPQATTVAASAVTSTSAQLNGSVTPKNAMTGAWFEWGTTTNYGNSTAVTNVGSGNAAVSVSNLVTALSPLTTYHFRLFATNSVGASNGKDLTFTTLGGDIVGRDGGKPSTLPLRILGVATLSPGTKQIALAGTPGSMYTIEAASDLNAPEWVVVSTNTAAANGQFSFIDSLSVNPPKRYDRVRTP